MSNDTKDYPEDSFENMISFAKKYGFMFPYLIDETQEVAKNMVPYVRQISLVIIINLSCNTEVE